MLGDCGLTERPVAAVSLSEKCLPSRDLNRWRDWWRVPTRWVQALADVPGILWSSSGELFVHQSHRPILEQAGCAFPDRGDVAVPTTAVIPGITLRPYQIAGVRFLLERQGAILADEMRLGKTAQIIAAHDPADGPLFVFGPLDARAVWVSWFRRRWPHLEPGIVEGRTYDPDVLRRPLVFAHYDLLSRWQTLTRAGMAVFDEAHVLSNPRSQRARAAALFAARARRTVLVTGTPLWNRPADLYAILSLANPGAWGSWTEFAVRYAAAYPGPHGLVAEGTSNVAEFQARVRQVMLRRTWDDVRAELPATNRRLVVTSIDAETRYSIERAVAALRNAEDRATTAGELAKLRRVVGEHKIAPAVAQARAVLDRGEKVVVWTWHRETAQRIAAQLPGSYLVTGAMAGKSRAAEMEAWRTDSAPRALVITMSVGQVAIDLSAARHAIFAELDWTPAVVGQAEMRTFSPDRPMEITHVAVDHPVELAVAQALAAKADNAARMGVPAGEAAIALVGSAFGLHETADMSRLSAALSGP